MMRTARVALRTGLSLRRAYSSQSQAQDRTKNMVSSRHPVSNLRLLRMAIPEDETRPEREFREAFERTQDWNHNHWVTHNTAFAKEKGEYIRRELERRRKSRSGAGGKEVKEREKETLTYDELALFYKTFLDSNHEKHMQYNKEWYLRHINLLYPAFKAFLASRYRVWRRWRGS